MTRPVAAAVLALAAGPAPAAGVLAEALSYTKPVPGGAYLFVALGDPAAEAKVKDPDARAKFGELRARYPETGLYRADSAELVWAVEDGGYAPYDGVFPAADGVHLARLDGDWWRTKDFTGGRARLPPAEEQRQLAAPAVSFFANGKLVRRWAVEDLVADPAALPHTPEHLLWTTGGVLTEDAGRFVVFTQDSARVAFDYRTGDLLSRTPAGLGNPRLKPILVATAALTAVVLGTWAWLVFGRRRGPAPAGA